MLQLAIASAIRLLSDTLPRAPLAQRERPGRRSQDRRPATPRRNCTTWTAMIPDPPGAAACSAVADGGLPFHGRPAGEFDALLDFDRRWGYRSHSSSPAWRMGEHSRGSALGPTPGAPDPGRRCSRGRSQSACRRNPWGGPLVPFYTMRRFPPGRGAAGQGERGPTARCRTSHAPCAARMLR